VKEFLRKNEDSYDVFFLGLRKWRLSLLWYPVPVQLHFSKHRSECLSSRMDDEICSEARN